MVKSATVSSINTPQDRTGPDNKQKKLFRNRYVLRDGSKAKIRWLSYKQYVPYQSEHFEQERLGNEDSHSKF
jgi:hypothetical protein